MKPCRMRRWPRRTPRCAALEPRYQNAYASGQTDDQGLAGHASLSKGLFIGGTWQEERGGEVNQRDAGEDEEIGNGGQLNITTLVLYMEVCCFHGKHDTGYDHGQGAHDEAIQNFVSGTKDRIPTKPRLFGSENAL